MIYKVFFIIFFTIFLGFSFIFYYSYNYNNQSKQNQLNAITNLTKNLNIYFSNSYQEDSNQIQNRAYLFNKQTTHRDFIYVQ
ncbi:hypothetical protein CPU12_09205 [Malaciobacter molluscorum LMG 25693]|uniref:Uncharacterized protein n=1 Tax=Malaciobacter molluscorum LMG 25693 TaxID=870501 RepID=A0A2G1DGI4_9BACT|nr:hypothetical protein [Malaciobacter molluscorum]AXX92523.1 hypothetical protein AMOL_1554 [Malaciobacter molluscorum LMG 25693]PHO17608.1 hypothetical protein CPU12_09205 [Malaciobacter molluscorum LMG 25693]RXJ93494.1 hypothetical protein CRV00_11235 [Malaciobacter molluscorum]